MTPTIDIPPALMSTNDIFPELEKRLAVLRWENSDLRAQVDRMRNVAELAVLATCCDLCDGTRHMDALTAAAMLYQRYATRLAKEKTNGSSGNN